jgi:hypothetical protein
MHKADGLDFSRPTDRSGVPWWWSVAEATTWPPPEAPPMKGCYKFGAVCGAHVDHTAKTGESTWRAYRLLLLASQSVDALSKQVQVAAMARGLLDHVGEGVPQGEGHLGPPSEVIQPGPGVDLT